MRIAILAIYVRGADAVGLQLADWTRAIAGAGHEVRLFVEQLGPGVAHDVLARTQVVDGRRLPFQADWQYLRTADVVICDYAAYYPLADCVRLLSSPAIVFSYHGVTPPEYWPESEGRAYLERSRRRAGLVHFADRAVVRSRFMHHELRMLTGFPSERIDVIPYAVPVPAEPPPEASPRSRGPVILSVGRLAGHKRPQLLVEALALLRQQIPTAQLVLAGDGRGPAHGPTVQAVRERAEHLGITDAVHLAGVIENDQLAHVYRSADLFAIASTHEGFCIPVVEAMAQGLPVVATACGALPETVGDAGIVVPDGDVRAMAAAMVELLQNDDLRHRLIDRGQRRARQYRPEAVQPQVLRLIEELPAQERYRPALPRLAQLVDLAALDAAAEVAGPPAAPHRRMPIVTKVATKLRGWFTSDLRRECDLVLQRQVAFNRSVTEAARAIDEWSAELSEQQAARSERELLHGEEQMQATVRTPEDGPQSSHL